MTAVVADATLMPAASRSSSTGCCVNTIPVVAPSGCVVMTTPRTTCVTVMLPVVAPASVPELNDSFTVPLADPTFRLAKVATPFTALTVVVPRSWPAPDANVTVIGALELATRLFDASRTCTTIAGLINAPLSTVVGCAVIERFVAPALVIKTLFETTLVAPVIAKLSV